MKFDLEIEDFTIVLNALHYYKKVEKRGNFQQYDTDRINQLRDKLSAQMFNQEDEWKNIYQCWSCLYLWHVDLLKWKPLHQKF